MLVQQISYSSTRAAVLGTAVAADCYRTCTPTGKTHAAVNAIIAESIRDHSSMDLVRPLAYSARQVLYCLILHNNLGSTIPTPHTFHASLRRYDQSKSRPLHCSVLLHGIIIKQGLLARTATVQFWLNGQSSRARGQQEKARKSKSRTSVTRRSYPRSTSLFENALLTLVPRPRLTICHNRNENLTRETVTSRPSSAHCIIFLTIFMFQVSGFPSFRPIDKTRAAAQGTTTYHFPSLQHDDNIVAIVEQTPGTLQQQGRFRSLQHKQPAETRQHNRFPPFQHEPPLGMQEHYDDRFPSHSTINSLCGHDNTIVFSNLNTSNNMIVSPHLSTSNMAVSPHSTCAT